MARIFRLQREEKYSDGGKYWNTIRSSRDKAKLVDQARQTSGHTRVIEEDDED